MIVNFEEFRKLILETALEDRDGVLLKLRTDPVLGKFFDENGFKKEYKDLMVITIEEFYYYAVNSHRTELWKGMK